MYIPNHFKLQEFFPRDFFRRVYPFLGDRMWILIDDRILWTADALRDRFGPMIVNDWLWRSEGGNQYRGYRPFDCAIGSEFSQHKYGRALDCKFTKTKTQHIRNLIIHSDYEDFEQFKYITCVEAEVTWLHFDVRNHDIVKQGIKLIYP